MKCQDYLWPRPPQLHTETSLPVTLHPTYQHLLGSWQTPVLSPWQPLLRSSRSSGPCLGEVPPIPWDTGSHQSHYACPQPQPLVPGRSPEHVTDAQPVSPPLHLKQTVGKQAPRVVGERLLLPYISGKVGVDEVGRGCPVTLDAPRLVQGRSSRNSQLQPPAPQP